MSRLRNYIDRSPDYVFIYDRAGQLIDANRLATEMLHADRSDMVGKHISELVPAEYADRADAFFKETLDAGGEQSLDDLHLPKELGGLTVKLRAFPIDEGIAFSLVDISPYKKTEAALRKSKKQMRDMAYVMAHDMKSPLANIEGLLTMLNSEGISDAQFDEVFAMIKACCQQLIDRNRALNKVLSTTEQMEVPASRVAFDDVLVSVEARLHIMIMESEATIHADFSDCAYVTYPVIHLESILQNLIANAIKFRKPDTAPEIQVGSELHDDQVYLIVADNGIGMDLPLVGKKLFGLFKRFKPDVSGDGIGLYLIKSLIESHDGSIHVESEPGMGTTFKILLTHERSQRATGGG